MMYDESNNKNDESGNRNDEPDNRNDEPNNKNDEPNNRNDEPDDRNEINASDLPQMNHSSSLPVNDPASEEPDEVDLRGFQVVRREFFAHVREPSIIFNDGKVGVNTACVRKLPDIEYVQFLIHREKKLLAIKPCDELDLYSFQWGTTKNGKRFPRQVTGRLFYMKICDLMGWIPQYRYKILGKLSKSNGDYIFVFDLKATETYERSMTSEGKKNSRVPVFPASWKDQFGIPYEEHQKALQVNMFDGYALFSLSDKENKSDIDADSSTENRDLKGNGGVPYEQQ